MNDTANLSNPITTVALILLGWLLSEFSSLFRSWRESRKRLKVVLFYLMELHHNFGIFNFEGFYDVFIDNIRQKFKIVLNEQDEKTVREFITPIILGFIKRLLGDELSKIKSNYQSSVEELATISPFQAFYLSGKHRIFDIFDAIDALFIEAKNLPENDHKDEVMKNIKKYMESKTFADTEKELENAIRGVALRIGPLAYIKSRRYLHRAKHKRPREFEKEIGKYLEALPQIFLGT
jgi:hypothetical protein